MPLTLELFNENNRSTGHLFIDRKSFIFHFYNLSDRDFFSDYLIEYGIYDSDLPFSHTHSYSMTNDPRHDALEHISSYDKSAFHLHIILSVNVDLYWTTYLFNQLKRKCDNTLLLTISNRCIEYILDISKKYFNELEKKQEARTIEQEYRQLKDADFERAKEEVLKKNRIQFASLSALLDPLSSSVIPYFHKLKQLTASNIIPPKNDSAEGRQKNNIRDNSTSRTPLLQQERKETSTTSFATSPLTNFNRQQNSRHESKEDQLKLMAFQQETKHTYAKSSLKNNSPQQAPRKTLEKEAEKTEDQSFCSRCILS